MADNPSSPENKPLTLKLTVLLCGIILVVTVAVTWLIRSTEPAAERVAASRRTAMLVSVETVERGTYRPRIVALGEVDARDTVSLSPLVEGAVIERSPLFEPGRRVAQGEVLLRLDPADYEISVATQRAALRQAEAELAVEMGRQRVARRDYELLADEMTSDSASLILREPQLEVAEANAEAARALLAEAELNLERTTIRAPFEAQILSREVSVGSRVSPGGSVGRLVGLEAYRVTATVPVEKLRQIAFAGGTSDPVAGGLAELRNRAAWGDDVVRTGRVDHFIGTLDDETRLARIQIEVSDPLALEAPNVGLPLLIIGSLLEVTIEGKPLQNVIRLPRGYLRQDDTVWVNEGGILHILPVTIVFRDADFVYLSEGLPDGAAVVTTGLSTVVEGAALRMAGEPVEVELE